MSVCLLNTLVGNLDVPGGVIGWPARGLGYPETNRSRYEPYAGYEGMLTPDMWFAHNPWPPDRPKWPEDVCLKQLFTHQTAPPYPYAGDFEEIWTKAGRPREVEALAIYGVNLAKSNANPEMMEKFLSKVPFIFSINTVYNETTEGFADIVLPDCHFLESLDIYASMAYMFNYPPGMDDWCFHLRMPAVEPEYERRPNLDIMFDLADRLGIRAIYNNILDSYTSTRNLVLEPRKDPIGSALDAKAREEKNLIIGADDRISNEEFTDRATKVLFGKEHDLKWFRENGFIRWKKKVEEAYWRPFINARVPVYFEFLEHDKEIVREIGKKIGFHMDWERYTPLVSWFPPRTSTKSGLGSEFDMAAFSYRDILHCGTWTVGNPWLHEMSQMNPYSYNIAMHKETAKRRSIEEGDIICLETPEGFKTLGRVKLMNGIHPETLGMSGHTGAWTKGHPSGKGKGPFYNALLWIDQEAICPVTGSIETSSRVKVYKAHEMGSKK
jgi:anaerobic selenocysteine-containing dehydrogenase